MRPELVFTVQPGGDFQTSNARLPGRVATGGPGTTPTCHRDRLPRYGGVPRAGKTARDFLRRPCRTIKNLPNLPEARLDLPQSKYARATDATLSGRPPVQAAGFEASWAFHARLVKVGNPPDPAVYCMMMKGAFLQRLLLVRGRNSGLRKIADTLLAGPRSPLI